MGEFEGVVLGDTFGADEGISLGEIDGVSAEGRSEGVIDG